VTAPAPGAPYQHRLLPGDIVAVRGTGWQAAAIRLGAALLGRPNTVNHVAGFDHYDSGGVPWGLEGRPGGVGEADMRPYVSGRYTVNNLLQPQRPLNERAEMMQDAKAMLGTRYDWLAILGDGFDDLHVKLWNSQWPHGLRPGEVVCSSFYAYLYEKYGWDHPDLGRERYCQPADWAAFCIENGYSAPLQ
jgi:hypothetical protein